MVCVLVSSEADHWSGQTKDYKIGKWFFSAIKHAALRNKNKDWLGVTLSGATCLTTDCFLSELAL